MTDTWYYTYNQRLKGIEEDISSVSASLAFARSTQRRLHAELSKVQGSLEQRLDRLSAAFDAFVEISDLRVTLGLFDPQGRVRHQARQLLAGGTLTGDLAEVSDVDGYWLAPALVALRIAVDGVADPESLAAASARDRLRATVFHVLGTGMLGGRPPVTATVTAAMLAEAVPVPGPTMLLHQRAGWTLAADGFFGEAGVELVRRRGVEFLRTLGQGQAIVDAVIGIGTAGATSVPLPREFPDTAEVNAAIAAGARLTALRDWVERTLAGWTNEPATEVDPSVRRALELLVEEGSPAELTLLARERELRAVIEGKGERAPAWDEPVGETLAVLHGDLADERHPSRRAVALRIHADQVLVAAERLAAVARRPFPERVATRTRQGTVALTRGGPVSLDEAYRRIEGSARVSGQRRAVAAGAVGVAAVFGVLAGVAGWGWVFVAVVALLVAGYQWRRDGRDRAAAAAGAVKAREALVAEVDRRMAVLTECRTTHAARQSTIDADLAALRAALG